jgi:hypothetical protein
MALEWPFRLGKYNPMLNKALRPFRALLRKALEGLVEASQNLMKTLQGLVKDLKKEVV